MGADSRNRNCKRRNRIWKFCEDIWNVGPIPESSPRGTAGGLAERMRSRTVAPRPHWEEDEGAAQETRDLLGEEGFLGQEAPLVSAGGWLVQY